MRALTEAEVERFRAEGFLAIDDMLSPTELAHWRSVVDAAIDDRLRAEGPEPSVEEITNDPENQRVLRNVRRMFSRQLNLATSSPRVRELLTGGDLQAVAAALRGASMQLQFDQALTKEPYGAPTPFHCDGHAPWDYPPEDAVTVWIALDEATLMNGCLIYVPGSHREPLRPAPPANEIGSLFDANPEWSGVMPVPCPVPPGGAVMHNGWTAHGAGGNMTPTPRRAMVAVYVAV